MRSLVLTIFSFILPLSVVGQELYDECESPFIIEQASTFCGQFSTLGASASNQPEQDCWFGEDSKDVWFSFIALGEFSIVEIKHASDLSFALYSGNCSSKLEQLYCSGTISRPTLIRESGLTKGANYYIRVTTNSTTSFSMCVDTYDPPTVEDSDCVVPDFVIKPLEGLKCNEPFTLTDRSFVKENVLISNYAWDFGEDVEISPPNPGFGPTLKYLTSGYKNISLTISSAENCVRTTSRSVYVHPCCDSSSTIDVHILTKEDPTCNGFADGEISVVARNGIPNYDYSINDSPFDFFPKFSNLEGGEYVIKAIDAQGCEGEETVTLIDPPKIEVHAGDDFLDVELGDSVMLNGSYFSPTSNALEVKWSPEEGISQIDNLKSFLSPTGNATYRLSVIDEFGCEYFDEILVTTISLKGIFVPNVIKYEAGQNGLFSFKSRKSGKTVLLFSIFDRWGNLIHQITNVPINDSSLIWDGTFNGQPLKPGNYSWVIQLEYFDNQIDNFSGVVTLIH